jgi:LysM repeat protein
MTIYRSSLAALVALILPGGSTAQATKPSTHTVKSGETLWSIARMELGDPYLWPRIYQLNKDVVSDPRALEAGVVLKLRGVAPQTAAAVPAMPAPAPAPAAMPRVEARPAREVVDTPPPKAPVVKVTGESEASEEGGMELFRRHRVATVSSSFKSYGAVKAHPLRQGEFLSGGFLTDSTALSFGSLLGPVTPEQIESTRARAAVLLFTRVALAPPEGASYAVGDTLVVVDRREGPVGYGQLIVPTGLVRITGENGAQAVGDVVAIFGPIRDGQAVLPAEKFSDPGAGDYQRISNGLEGRVLAAREHSDLRLPHQILFLDIGRRDGVALGDLFEARRTPGPQRRAAADATDEVMATLQVVHIGERTATVKVRNVMSPDIPPGTRVKLMAKLPS